MKYKNTLKIETRKVVKALIITLSLMIAALGAVFLITTSESAQKGYALQQEKIKNEELKSINSNLTTKITEAASSLKIEENQKVNKMDPAEAKNYVTSEDNKVY